MTLYPVNVLHSLVVNYSPACIWGSDIYKHVTCDTCTAELVDQVLLQTLLYMAVVVNRILGFISMHSNLALIP